MRCYLCYRDLTGLVPDIDYDIVYRPYVCTTCVDRAKDIYGLAWPRIVRPGCLSGGQPDPLLFNPRLAPGQRPTLGHLLDAYTRMAGVPKHTAVGVEHQPGEVIYHPAVPIGRIFLFGGVKAGQSAVIYTDAVAHLEDRIRPRVKDRMREIEDSFDGLERWLDERCERLEHETNVALSRASLDAVLVYLDIDRELYHARTGRWITRTTI